MKLWNRIILLFVLLVAIPYYWLLVDARTDSVPAKPIDIVALRRAAQDVPGPKPVAIEYAAVAARRAPGAALVAGGGLKRDLIGIVSYRLVTPNGDILIDTGLSQAQANDMGIKLWKGPAQARVNSWMDSARLILFTHEHPDHVGGFLASPHFAQIASKAVILPEMIAGIREIAPSRVANLPKPLLYGEFAAVAPGVVLMRTPGHTPGSQMVFVQLQNGREYLFTGDTASMARNVGWVRPRSHLVSDWLAPEDRGATIGWIKGLSDLAKRNPRLTLVYSHDLAWLQSGRRGPGFHSDFLWTTTPEDRDPLDEESPSTAPVGNANAIK